MPAEASDPHLHDGGVYHCPGVPGEKRRLMSIDNFTDHLSELQIKVIGAHNGTLA
jgi:hypothetical protein